MTNYRLGVRQHEGREATSVCVCTYVQKSCGPAKVHRVRFSPQSEMDALLHFLPFASFFLPIACMHHTGCTQADPRRWLSGTALPPQSGSAFMQMNIGPESSAILARLARAERKRKDFFALPPGTWPGPGRVSAVEDFLRRTGQTFLLVRKIVDVLREEGGRKVHHS